MKSTPPLLPSSRTFPPGQVGPIAEEVVFRGCSVPVLLGAGVSRMKIVWLSPLLFGFGESSCVLDALVAEDAVDVD